MTEKQYFVDDQECERYMLVFGDEGTRIVDNETGKELYAMDIVTLLNSLSAEKRHNENKDKRLYKKLISKIDFLEKVIMGDL